MSVGAFTARLLVLSMVQFSLSNGPILRASTQQPDLKQRLELFGVGAELKVKLANGDQMRGSVERLGDDRFLLLSEKGGAPREIAYTELANVNYPHRGYKVEGVQDPIAAKRMIVQLGVGEHIMVKTPTDKTHGHIRQINGDHFLVQADGETTTRQIAYSEIQKVHENLSFGATIAIVVGIAAAVVLILVLSGEEDVDVLPN